MITPFPTPTPVQPLRGLQPFEICNNGVDDDGDGGTDNGDHDCSPGAQGACPPGSPPTCIVFTGTTVPYCGGETLPPGCDGKRTPTITPLPSPEATPGPAATSRLDPYAECILFPFSLKCQNGVPTDTNLPPLTPPDPTTCNLDKNYPGCPGADIFKFNQESIACESAANRNIDLHFCRNPAVIQSATSTASTLPTPVFDQGDPCDLDLDSIPCQVYTSDRIKFCSQVPTPEICPAKYIPKTATPLPDMLPSPSPSPSPSPIPTTTPNLSPTPTVITNINNNQVTVRNDGGYTVQNTAGAVTATPDCPAQSATVVLGPSPMQNGGARILAALDPCILTDGTVILNLPDEKGIQLVAANIQGGQTTQSVVVPMQRIAPITEGQTLYNVNLNGHGDGQITGTDPATGNPVTLNGNINALFLRNNGGQDVDLSDDNSVALNAILRNK